MTGPREEPQAALAAICFFLVFVLVILDLLKGIA